MTSEEQLQRAIRFNDLVGQITITVAGVGLGLMGPDLISPVLHAFQKWLLPLLQQYYGRLAVEIIFMGSGYGLYKLKVHRQRLYGSLECMFAIATSWVLLTRAAAGIQPEHIVGLVAAGYIFVRGLSNYFEGRAKVQRAL